MSDLKQLQRIHTVRQRILTAAQSELAAIRAQLNQAQEVSLACQRAASAAFAAGSDERAFASNAIAGRYMEQARVAATEAGRIRRELEPAAVARVVAAKRELEMIKRLMERRRTAAKLDELRQTQIQADERALLVPQEST